MRLVVTGEGGDRGRLAGGVGDRDGDREGDREGDRDRERDLDRCDSLSLKRSSSVLGKFSMDCISL